MSSTSAVTGYRINSLDSVQAPLAALANAYFEVEVPGTGSTYTNLRLRGDQLTTWLNGVVSGRSVGPNQRPDLWKEVTHMTRAEAGPGGGDVFEELAFDKCCMFTTVIVEFYRETPTSPEIRKQLLVAEFDGGPNPAYHICRDGRFDTTVLLPARFIKAEDARDFIPYNAVPAGYNWPEGKHTSYYVGSPLEEQYFTRRAPGGPVPAAPVEGGDATYWAPSSYTAIPPAAATYDDTAVRGLIAGLDTRLDAAEADLVFVEQEVTDLQNEHADLQTESTQTRGWIGTLGSLLTSTKGNLVAAINEVLGKIPVAYTRLGFNSDGYLTQAYATTILATKAATAYTPNYQVEVAAGGTLSPGLNGGKSYALNGTNVQLDNPATDPSSYGKVDLYRVIGQQTAKLTAAPGATIDGNPSVTFQPGEWFVLKQQAGGHTIVMRASTLTPTPGAGSTYTAGAGINISPQNVISATSTGSSGAIDYVNFVAHATNTVLSVADMGKHHVFTGTGQSLWTVALPAAADVAGKLISIQVGNSASGMWELQAADIDGEPARRMWSREVALLWSNGTSWRKLGGRSIPLVLTVGFPNGNQALGGQQITTLNFTQKVSGNAPDEMLFAAGLAIRALRKGLYEPALTAYCIGSSQFRPIQAIASVNGDYGSTRSVNTPCLVGADGAGLFYSSLSMASNPLALDAGDYVNIRTYTDAAIEVQNYDALRPRFSLNEVLTW
ncbi:hypothetical protein [Hymenobacter convexus]|uniref:hypothetical protein n=1 Tax=Hymenobacter sp. CA1UV-4 TaxID=3063782 RepID=UPI002713FA14|nr:hypothetical protein [Hymenobacter sp. CA1UV-4]MDO7851404.1 hypothetical protein [Hymenobacter sp. CA1UV-4]